MIINSTGNQEILYDFIIDEIGHFKTLIDLKQSTSLVRCLMEWDQIPQLIMCFAIFPVGKIVRNIPAYPFFYPQKCYYTGYFLAVRLFAAEMQAKNDLKNHFGVHLS